MPAARGVGGIETLDLTKINGDDQASEEKWRSGWWKREWGIREVVPGREQTRTEKSLITADFKAKEEMETRWTWKVWGGGVAAMIFGGVSVYTWRVRLLLLHKGEKGVVRGGQGLTPFQGSEPEAQHSWVEKHIIDRAGGVRQRRMSLRRNSPVAPYIDDYLIVVATSKTVAGRHKRRYIASGWYFEQKVKHGGIVGVTANRLG